MKISKEDAKAFGLIGGVTVSFGFCTGLIYILGKFNGRAEAYNHCVKIAKEATAEVFKETNHVNS